MFSINMRLFKTTTLFLVLAFVGTHRARCLPLEESESLTSTRIPSSHEDHYDQRQNGTENYIVHIDGVALIIAPVEAFLLANELMSANQSEISTISSIINNHPKPSNDDKPNLENTEKPSNISFDTRINTEHLEVPNIEQQLTEKSKTGSSKSTKRSSLRLMNLLAPFIRRFYHQIKDNESDN